MGVKDQTVVSSITSSQVTINNYTVNSVGPLPDGRIQSSVNLNITHGLGTNTYSISVSTTASTTSFAIQLVCTQPNYNITIINTVATNNMIYYYFQGYSGAWITFYKLSFSNQQICYQLNQVYAQRKTSNLAKNMFWFSVTISPRLTCNYTILPIIQVKTDQSLYNITGTSTITSALNPVQVNTSQITISNQPLLLNPYSVTNKWAKKYMTTFTASSSQSSIYINSGYAMMPLIPAGGSPSTTTVFKQFSKFNGESNGYNVSMISDVVTYTTLLPAISFQLPPPKPATGSGMVAYNLVSTQMRLQLKTGNLTAADTFLCLNTLPLVSPPFPFGLVNGNLWSGQFYITIDLPQSISIDSDIANVLSPNQDSILSFVFSRQAPILLDTTKPILIDIIFTLINSNIFLFQAKGYDTGGIMKIICNVGSFTFTLNESDWVRFSNSTSVDMQQIVSFQGQKPSDFSINNIKFNVIDIAGNVVTQMLNTVLPNRPIDITSIQFDMAWQPSDIIYFEFLKSKVDVTNAIITNTLYFMINTSSITNYIYIRPVFKINSFGNDVSTKQLSFSGLWNPILQLFQIDFSIPMNIYQGPLNYSLEGIPDLNYIDIKSIHPINSTLMITCSNGDLLPPMITDVRISTLEYANGTIQFFLTITDLVNGLDFAEINITSNVDPLPFTFIVTPQSKYLIGGDSKVGIYRLDVTVPQQVCLPQTFTLSSARTKDTSYNIGWTPTAQAQSNYWDGVFDPLNSLDPFKLAVTVVCPIPALHVPTIGFLNFSHQVIDVGLPDTVYTLDFNVFDSVSGISLRHVPKVYVTTIYGEYVVFDAWAVNSTFYTCNFKMPYGFGYSQASNFSLHIYGVTNTILQMTGVSNVFIATRQFTRQSLLLSHLPIYRNGGILGIVTRWITSQNQQWILCSINGQNYTSSWTDSGMLVNINLTGISLPELFTCWPVAFSGILSNKSLTINTLPTLNFTRPTPPANPCEGGCNNGYCSDSGCTCNLGFSGPNCDQKIVPVDTTPSPNSPDVVSNETNIKSIINIISLQELSLDGQLVQEYKFENGWNFTTNSTTSNSSTFEYSTQLPGNRTTIISVVIQLFTKESDVAFAGQILNMQAGTLKYFIAMDSYQFASQTNYLQLLFGANLESSNPASNCGQVQSGQSDSIQWIKLNINGRSLYGRFITQAVIDYRPTRIQNIIINSGNGTVKSATLSSVVAIQIPFYSQLAYLDPDFSQLLDSTTGNCQQSSGLTTPQIIGISVACAVAGLVLIMLGAFTIKKK